MEAGWEGVQEESVARWDFRTELLRDISIDEGEVGIQERERGKGEVIANE